MSLVFLAFLIMTCIFVYQKGARQCMQHSFAGTVLWYYATIILALIAVSIVFVGLIGCCYGCSN